MPCRTGGQVEMAALCTLLQETPVAVAGRYKRPLNGSSPFAPKPFPKDTAPEYLGLLERRCGSSGRHGAASPMAVVRASHGDQPLRAEGDVARTFPRGVDKKCSDRFYLRLYSTHPSGGAEPRTLPPPGWVNSHTRLGEATPRRPSAGTAQGQLNSKRPTTLPGGRPEQPPLDSSS
jgi:hypothetical protein